MGLPIIAVSLYKSERSKSYQEKIHELGICTEGGVEKILEIPGGREIMDKRVLKPRTEHIGVERDLMPLPDLFAEDNAEQDESTTDIANYRNRLVKEQCAEYQRNHRREIQIVAGLDRSEMVNRLTP